MTPKELKLVLVKHEGWLKGSNEGARANLHHANLQGAELQGAELQATCLHNYDTPHSWAMANGCTCSIEKFEALTADDMEPEED